MNAQTFTLVWVAVLAFGCGWWSCRLKDVVDWSLSKRRRAGVYGQDWGGK